MSGDQTTVVFTSYSNENPYFSLLFDSLEQVEVEITDEPITLFLPLTRIVFRSEEIDVIHLGWLYRFFFDYDVTPFKSINHLIVVFRTVLFCLDLILVRISGTRLVWTVHNKYHHERKYYSIEKVLNIFVANIVDSIAVKCESARQTITHIYKITNKSKVHVIPDGNYSEAYPDEVDKNTARQYLNINDSPFIYLFFGLIRPYKGVDDLIDTYSSIDDDSTELWIVGNPDSKEMEQMVREMSNNNDSVHSRLNYIPTDEVQYYLNAADVLVLPYTDVLNSGTVHLGLTFGKPIIAPKIGCIPSLLSEENSTLLYNQSESSGLKSSLIRGRKSPVDLIGNANKRKSEQYEWFKSAKLYKEIYVS